MNKKTADTISTYSDIKIRRYSPATRGFTLVQVAIVLMIAGLLVGSMFMGEELVVIYKVHAQISQIGAFDEAVATFNEKFEGLPGDLLAVMAERQGLPAGDGTPSHGDGDGKISPCNLGWQWHLGCETALFWSQLSVSGMIPGNYTADSRFTDNRLNHVNAMDPYLPRSPLMEGVYVAIWSSVANQPSPKPQLPYGNYYEISRIMGVADEKFVDDSKALTPEQSYDIDRKMDDGLPLSGRVVVNGEADWPKDAWGTYAKPGVSSCVFTDETYNTSYILRAHAPLCHIAIALECCKKQEDGTQSKP